MFEYLDNCDPNVDPLCKEHLEHLKDQIEFELFAEPNKVGQDSPEITATNTKSLVVENNQLQDTAAPVRQKQSRNDLHKNPGEPPWKNDENGSDSALLSKKSVEGDSGSGNKSSHNSDDIPVIYFLSKYI